MSETDTQHAGTAQEVAPPQPAHPKAFDPEQWARIPEDLREEVLERASWLAFRGVQADAVLATALDGMREDLAKVDPEPSWWSVRAIAGHWPGLRRLPSGHYRQAILALASAVEGAAWAEACERGSVLDPYAFFAALLPDPEFGEVAVAVFESRVNAYLVPPQEEVVPEEADAAAPDGYAEEQDAYPSDDDDLYVD
jgi:hypothetical protein